MTTETSQPTRDAARERVHARRARRYAQYQSIEEAICRLQEIESDPTSCHLTLIRKAESLLARINRGLEWDSQHGKAFQLPDRG